MMHLSNKKCSNSTMLLFHYMYLIFFSFQGKIYVIGGFGVSKAILNSQECYDPDTDKWTKLTSMKKMCGFVGGTLVDRPVHFEDRPNSSQNNQSTKFGYYKLQSASAAN